MAAALGVIAALLCATPSASAQSAGPTGFDVQNFRPAIDRQLHYFGATSARAPEHLQLNASLLLHDAVEPLVLVDRQGDPLVDVVSNQLTANLLASFGLLGLLELGLDVPLILAQSGDDGLSTSDAGFGIGDIRVSAKALAFSTAADGESSGLRLAGQLDLYLPTGDEEMLQGDDGFRSELRGIVDYTLSSMIRFAFNLGWAIRPDATVLDAEVNDTLNWTLAADYSPIDDLDILAELVGQTAIGADDLGEEDTPIELLLGARYRALERLSVEAGIGKGLNGGFGTPSWRILAGASYAFSFEPDPDPDGDGVLADQDICPNEPEDADGYQDADGCPDPDNDQDGILDEDDECPTGAEDYDGFEDEDGCPDPDNDQDGILDADDLCPDQPEDIDGFEDENGCPDPDNDQDGILDADDACPTDAEDVDGFSDEDGCPEPDNDGDGYLDIRDGCPDEPETYNGKDDFDGCPDESSLLRVECEEVALFEPVTFRNRTSARIVEESIPLLDRLAAALNAAVHIRRVRVVAHTPIRGDAEENQEISEQRAAAVREYLISQGVDPSRLIAEGRGGTEPIVEPEESVDDRVRNARVEVEIVDQDFCVQ